jgi:hypothetical protein
MKIWSSLILAAAAVSLTACGDDLSRTFGFQRDAPDEFQVTTRAPLSMPPNFDLRPPRPGESRPQEQSQRAQAEAALVPEATLAGRPAGGGTLSPGQAALVAQAGPSVSDNIRDKVDAEAQLDRPRESFTDRLMFWRSEPPAGTLVDPKREAQRLRGNAALGQDPSAGDTPIVQPPKRGWFDWLF